MDQPTESVSLAGRICAEQEQRWTRGQKLLVEHYLEEHPNLRTDRAALLELVYREYCLREKLGQQPKQEEYFHRFPALHEDLQRVFEVHHALDTSTLAPRIRPSVVSDYQTCADRDTLSQLAAGKLSGDRLTALNEHLRLCASCRNTFGEVSAARTSLRQDLGFLRDYRLVREIGRGGMGAVFEAVHVPLDRRVAVKVLPQNRMENREAVSRFQREMRAIGKLDHPNIVRAQDAGEVDGQHFLVMEFVDGVDLAVLANCVGPLPIPEACELIRQVAIGLSHVHEHRLVHRDVKPSNVVVTHCGVVKLLDLGLALLSESIGEPEELTWSGQVMGTLDYMAPEQFGDSHAVDARADIYGLGATLYRLLTGRAPYEDSRYNTPMKKLMAIATSPVAPILEYRDDVAAGLYVILNKLLAKNPNDRYASAGEVASALVPFVSGSDLPSLVARAGEIGKRDSVQTKISTVVQRSSALIDTDTSHEIPQAVPASRQIQRRFGSRAAILTVLCLAMLGAAAFLLFSVLGTSRTESAKKVPVQDSTHPVVKNPSKTMPIVALGWRTVTNTHDDGPGSLRDAINQANSHTGLDEIRFAIPASNQASEDEGRFTIALSSPLPTITDPVILDGTAQPGYKNIPIVQLSGKSVLNGLVISAGGSVVKGLAIGGFFGNGMVLKEKGGNIVEGNHIGVAQGNGGAGIGIADGSGGNRIGTNGDGKNDEAERNVIVRNGFAGIVITGIGSDQNVVAGNYIGTDREGARGLGNGTAAGAWPAAGVIIHEHANGNRIGTDGNGAGDTEERNIISSNTLIGVFLSNCENNVIAGNFIGTDPGGVKAVPNGSGGVLLFYGAHRTRIGTDGSDDAFNAAERNVISGNAAGIQIDSNENWVAGNYIGVDATGSGALGNSGNGILIIAGTRRNRIGTDNNGRNDEIERNVISGNHHSGIHFDGSGADGNVVAGNYIGLDAVGSASIGNRIGGITIVGDAKTLIETANRVEFNNGYQIRDLPAEAGK